MSLVLPRLTASFRTLYVFVVIEHGSHRLVHCNATAYPSAAGTLHQLREVLGLDHRYQFLCQSQAGQAAQPSSVRVGVAVLRRLGRHAA